MSGFLGYDEMCVRFPLLLVFLLSRDGEILG